MIKKIDTSDIITFLGLAFLWYGSFLLSPAWSFILVGFILFVGGVLMAMRGGEEK